MQLHYFPLRISLECTSFISLIARVNADLKICQYLRLHMKIMCRRFHIKTPLLFKICAREICDKVVHKHSETIEYVKNQPIF